MIIFNYYQLDTFTMTVYQKYITIEDPKNVIFSDLPFAAGQRVKVVITTEDGQQLKDIETLKTLFKVTQSLPQIRAINADEIAAEIAAYRAGH
ncbi:MAG: hypothetical protein JO235_02110 [Chroococcidiopsidaceae cyanobacterium CP_BM_RX_35]|nr:hypothetical protein [Chroococcidiopsidaceae cyanobacterium CP_BM_RX_35]